MSKRAVGKHMPEPESSEEEEEFEDDEEEEEVDPIEKINSLPLEQKRRVYGLKKLVRKTRELQMKKRDRIAAIEAEYLAKMAPLFELRRKIVMGEHEPTDSEVKAGEKPDESKVEEIPSDDEDDKKKADDKKEKKVTVEAPEDEDMKSVLKAAAAKADGGIPFFWLTAMKNNEVLESQVMERDEGALKALQNVTSEFIDNDPKKGFRLTFTFGDNDFFDNKVLTKEYRMDPEDTEDFSLDEAVGCPINWKSTDNKLTVVIKEKKQRHKGGKGVRIVKREEKCPSFFHFFDPPKMPGSDDDEPEDDEEDDVEETLQLDFEAGQAFHESLIPRAVYFYTGENIADMASGMQFGNMMGGDEEDEEEEDEEEESEEEEPAPKKGKGGRGGRGAAGGRGGRGGKDECPQQ